jgi:3-phenylpropionate/trans-cinnamate dioxygenase ferredoxin reductase component
VIEPDALPGDRSTIVVVGANTAGVAAVERMRLLSFGGRIILVDKERAQPFYRPALSKDYLTGDRTVEEICTLSEDRASDLDVELLVGVTASALHTTRRVVELDGDRVRYDGLIIATGARAHVPSGLGMLTGVHTLRSLEDARGLAQGLQTRPSHVAIVGGGFIGSEVAAAIRTTYELPVTIVEAQGRLLERVLPEVLADPVAQLHRDNDVEIRCGASVTALVGRHQVEGLVLADGSTLQADLVVMGVGTVPETDWLTGSGLAVDNGVLTAASLRTSAKQVFAAGDVARWGLGNGMFAPRSEHWDAARAQGELAASNLIIGGDEPYVHTGYAWSDQYERRLQMIGSIGPQIQVVASNRAAGTYLAVSNDDDVVGGAVGLDSRQLFKRARALVANRSSWQEALAADWQPRNGSQFR